jgi:hypothetical protein
MVGVALMKGFFHPEHGYWQTITDVAQAVRDSYPSGTIEVPLKPSGAAEWDADQQVWVEPPASQPDPAIVLAGFTRAINAHVEAQARAWQYNSAAHLASYFASTVPKWSAEAQAFIGWRDQVWLASVAILDAVQGGASIPASHEAFLSTLPALTRP